MVEAFERLFSGLWMVRSMDWRVRECDTMYKI